MIVFKDIPGYEGYYQAGTDGTIRSVDKPVRQWSGGTQLKRGKVLSPATDRLGYMRVALSRYNKLTTYPVHRLVALTHILNPENLREINHKDGNKSNNDISNLEWSTHLDNMRHAYKNNLVPIQSGDAHCRTIFKKSEHPKIIELHKSGLTAPAIGRMLGCSHDTIYRIISPEKYKRSKKNVPSNEITI